MFRNEISPLGSVLSKSCDQRNCCFALRQCFLIAIYGIFRTKQRNNKAVHEVTKIKFCIFTFIRARHNHYNRFS